MFRYKLLNERSLKMIALRESRAGDIDEIRGLLNAVKLPVESLDGGVTKFFVAEENRRKVGIAGFEFYGTDALLRSVAIPAELRRRGIGSQIVDLMLAEARKMKMNRVILLTETARDFFLSKGFEVVERSAINNDAMKKSSEFSYACPKSAVCMMFNFKQ